MTPAKVSDTLPKRATVSSMPRDLAPKRTAARRAAAESPPLIRGRVARSNARMAMVMARAHHGGAPACPGLPAVWRGRCPGEGAASSSSAAPAKSVSHRLHRDGKGLPRSFVRCQDTDLQAGTTQRQTNLGAREPSAVDSQPGVVGTWGVTEQQAMRRLDRRGGARQFACGSVEGNGNRARPDSGQPACAEDSAAGSRSRKRMPRTVANFRLRSVRAIRVTAGEPAPTVARGVGSLKPALAPAWVEGGACPT